MSTATVLGRVVSAVAGRTLARSVGGAAAGPAGMAIGVALPFVARRMGPMGMAAMAVGAWAINRIARDMAEKEEARALAAVPVKRVGPERAMITTPPPIAMVVGD